MPSKLRLPELNRQHFRHAVDRQHVILYPTASLMFVKDVSQPLFEHVVHLVPAYSDKPAPPLKTPDLTTQPRRDPFGGPQFGPDDRERVVDLETLSTGSDNATTSKHSLVQNLHALCEEHSMIVPTFVEGHFRSQTTDLLLSDLEAAWQIISQYREDEREVIMFYNGGPLAGASQPHLHMQFCPFQNRTPGPVAVARDLPLNLPTVTPFTLPLPWIMFCVPLGPSPKAQTAYEAYVALLKHSKSFIDELDDSDTPPAGPKRESYNFLLTSTHAFLMPRTDRLSRIPRRASRRKQQSESDRKPRMNGDTEDEKILLSVNGLLVIGYWYLGSKEEVDDLLGYTPGQVLVDAGYKNKVGLRFALGSEQ
ncbi:ATP adenylyltransferase domain-containing protein [Microbotryomycetes sp. JL221]|nr:ATP adenylyltransferase domain-containing protein [Microbotryomycetes sp. JL221]